MILPILGYMSGLVTIDDFATAFALFESEGLEGYVNGGSGTGLTMASNRAAWDAIEIRPRILTGVGSRDLTTVVLGTQEKHPIMVAPVGFQGYVHADGARALASGAVAAGARYCHSTFGAASFADLEQIDGLRWWFQLYSFTDAGLNRSLIERAQEAGAEAIVLTVDLAALGHRDRDAHTGFALRGNRQVACVAEVGHPDPKLSSVWNSLDHDISWETLQQVLTVATVPVLVKGVLRGDDAATAIAQGAAGVIVSNHGGRQLDTAVSTQRALVDVVEAVDGRGEVLVDSGIRYGTDVVKALGLGASAVLVGRPPLWGLGVAGHEGVARVLALMVEDFDRAMALVGASSVGDITNDLFVLPR